MKPKFKLLLGATTLTLACAGLVQAQPDANGGAPAENPPNRPAGGGNNRGGNNNRGGRANMTEEQRKQLEAQNQKMRELQQRQSMTRAGLTDVKDQDVLMAYLTNEETARQTLRDKWQSLQQLLRNNDTPDTQIAGSLNEFRAAVEDEKARKDKARTELDTKLGLAQKPRLDAMLMTSGLIGDESDTFGGRGGFGNFNFGNIGNFGNFGGGNFGGGRGGN